VDAEHLRYRFLNAWDAALQSLDAKFGFLASPHQIVSFAGDKEQVPDLAACPLKETFPMLMTFWQQLHA
jgi:1,4-alpha-glucan branching enzyme